MGPFRRTNRGGLGVASPTTLSGTVSPPLVNEPPKFEIVLNFKWLQIQFNDGRVDLNLNLLLLSIMESNGRRQNPLAASA
jgi:hypothetical protein